MNQILSNRDKNPENRRNTNSNYNRNYNRNNINRNNMTHTRQPNYYNSNKNSSNAGYYNNRRMTNNQQRNMRNNYYSSEKKDTTLVAKFFAIILLIYGLSVIGQSVYALNSSQYKPKDKIEVSVDKMGREVTMTITGQKPIKDIRYKWNEGEETKIQGNDRVKIEQKIDIPNGNNVLNITISDYYGNKSSYQKSFIYESKDSIKPNIETNVSGTKITLTVSDETKLAYLTYNWNDEPETRYDVPEGQTLINLEIEVMQGKNTFTINAVDGEDNKTTFSKTIIGDTKPEVTILTEGTNVVVKAKDDEGIAKLEIRIDGEVSEEETGNNKEISAKIPVSAGTHEIKAIVTNVNGLKSSKEITADV